MYSVPFVEWDDSGQCRAGVKRLELDDDGIFRLEQRACREFWENLVAGALSDLGYKTLREDAMRFFLLSDNFRVACEVLELDYVGCRNRVFSEHRELGKRILEEDSDEK